jgi:hypothetical protein
MAWDLDAWVQIKLKPRPSDILDGVAVSFFEGSIDRIGHGVAVERFIRQETAGEWLTYFVCSFALKNFAREIIRQLLRPHIERVNNR